MSENNELAGVSDPNPRKREDEPVREVKPIMFDKDYLDFRAVETEESQEDPKGSSAPGSVSMPKSVTGLEDWSEEDLETPAPANAEKAS